MKKRKTQTKAQKAFRVKQIITACSIVVIVIAAGVGTTKLTHDFDHSRVQTTHAKQIAKKETKELTLRMVGDNLMHMPLIRNAEMPNGGYNFDSLYAKMASSFQEADISVIVQETVLGGESLGYSGYPLFNSPQEVGDAISRAGFDIVLHATNHTLDKGEQGITNTLNFWKKYPEMYVLGINETEDAYHTVNYIEKNGIKLAVLNYTTSINGMPLPSGKPYMINIFDEEKAARDLAVAEENADFTIVFMHWGTEYSFSADKSQKELAQLMCDHGADLIMGSHPHVIEPVEWVTSESGNKTLVFYSLGNYVSRQKEAANLVGAMGEVKICFTEEQGAYIASASVMPTVTQYNSNSRGFYVYPLKDYTDELAVAHGVAQYDGKVSVERFRKIVDDVFQDNTAVSLIY